MDKETVIKHQFWFLLGGYALVWLAAVLWIWGVAGDQIAKVQGEYKKAADSIRSSSHCQCRHFPAAFGERV